jgi:hypothetical protein
MMTRNSNGGRPSGSTNRRTFWQAYFLLAGASVLAAVIAWGSVPLEISTAPTNGAIPVHVVDIHQTHLSVDQNFLETGHTLMRRVDGALNAVVVRGNLDHEDMAYLFSLDGGSAWKALDIETKEPSTQPALDSNEYGAYIAYVSKDGSRQVGHVVRIDDPRGKAQIQDSGPLTDAQGQNQYSSIAASRLGLKSVAYGWFDKATGRINVGVSPDGIHFPPTRTIAVDKNARYGPAVAIFGKYLVVTYQTTNEEIAPKGAPTGSYPAWLESTDGGKTWSRPDALFGKDIHSFPEFETEVSGAVGSTEKRSIRLTGLQDDHATFIQGLAWEASTISASRVFVTSVLSYSVSDERGSSTRAIGVVSSKLPQKGGNWAHVVANPITNDLPPELRNWGPNSSFLQYSALPGTPLRVVSYVDQSQSGGEDSLVAAISTDNAEHFTHVVSYKATRLGLPRETHLALRSSLCLWRDADGTVSLDTFLAPIAGQDHLWHARLPIGIRLKGGDSVNASNW